MEYFATQSESVREIKVNVNGQNEDIIQFCARSINSLTCDIQTLTTAMKDYYNIDGRGKSATKRFLNRIAETCKDHAKDLFKSFKASSVKCVLNRNLIIEMIQAAKHIESSLYYALTTILLAQNEFK